jgi:hypothetical protein
MIVEKQLRWQHEDFGSRSVLFSVSHEELGMRQPTNPDEVRAAASAMSREVQALIFTEEVKLGRIKPDQLHERLRLWLPPIDAAVDQAVSDILKAVSTQ